MGIRSNNTIKILSGKTKANALLGSQPDILSFDTPIDFSTCLSIPNLPQGFIYKPNHSIKAIEPDEYFGERGSYLNFFGDAIAAKMNPCRNSVDPQKPQLLMPFEFILLEKLPFMRVPTSKNGVADAKRFHAVRNSLDKILKRIHQDFRGETRELAIIPPKVVRGNMRYPQPMMLSQKKGNLQWFSPVSQRALDFARSRWGNDLRFFVAEEDLKRAFKGYNGGSAYAMTAPGVVDGNSLRITTMLKITDSTGTKTHGFVAANYILHSGIRGLETELAKNGYSF